MNTPITTFAHIEDHTQTSQRFFQCLLTLALSSVLLIAASSADAQWRRLPMPPGEEISDILHHPSGPVFAGGVRGAYRSTDAGMTWELVLPAARVLHLELSSAGILAGTEGGLFSSADLGETWTSSFVHPAGVPAVRDLAVDPTDPQTVILSAFYIVPPFGYLFRSSDGGRTFTDASGDLPDSVWLTAISSDGGTWFAVSESGSILFKSTDQGASWVPVTLDVLQPDPTDPTYFESIYVQAILPDPVNLQVLHLGTQANGVWRSNDGGLTFFESSTGLPTGTWVRDLHITADARFLLAADAGGVFTSPDGTTWSPAGPMAPQSARAVSSDPASPDTVLTGVGFMGEFPAGVLRSTDFGDTWTTSNGGMETALGFMDLAVSPIDPDRLLAASLIGSIVSSDRGESWTLGTDVASKVEASGVSANRFFAVPQNQPPGLTRSDDGGLTWTPSDTGLPSFGNAAVGRSLADPQTLWFGSLYPSPAIFRSVDEGATWDPTGSGVPPFAFDLFFGPDPTDSLRLYVGLGGEGLIRTTDGGTTWIPTPFTGSANDVAVDPGDGSVYVAGAGQVWKSVDEGQSFSDITGDLCPVSEVEVGAEGGIVYVKVECAPSVLASHDGGATWHQVSNAPSFFDPYQLGGTLTSDPTVPGRLYLLAPTGDFSLFRGIHTIDWDPSQAGTADLRLSKFATPDTADVGDIATFTLVVENVGPAAAPNARVIDNLPLGFAWVSDDCGAGAPIADQWMWSVGDMAPATSATCTIQGLVDFTSSGVITNRAEALSDVTDPTPADARAEASLSGPRAPAIPVLGDLGVLLFVVLIGFAGVFVRRR